MRFSAPVARGDKALAQFAHDGRTVGGEVHEDGARRGSIRPIGGDSRDDVGRGQRQQCHVGEARHRRDVRRGRSPGYGHHCVDVEVMHDHVVAVGHEVGGDGPPDVAQPDHTCRHRPSLTPNALAAP